MMRIITGSARGTRLFTLPGDMTRPTTQMTKEGIFSAIQFEVMGARVLDLFAGTGQLGLEALSRGAKSSVLVDSQRKAIEVIAQNAQRTHLFDQCTILCADVFAFLKTQTEPFSIIFADPPYGENLLPKVVEKILEYQLLSEHGVLILESSCASCIPQALLSSFANVKHYKYGKTHCLMLRKEKEE